MTQISIYILAFPVFLLKTYHFLIFICLSFRYELQVTDGKFQMSGDKPSGWTHVIVNYLEPNAGTKLYYDSVYHRGNIPKFGDSYTPGNGRTVIGRRNVNSDSSYASLEIDELAMFNASLSDVQIGELFDSLWIN